MDVSMAVRFARWGVGGVLMAMVLVMHMGMGVLERFMDMAVVVAFREMQVKADDHQHGGRDQAQGYGVSQQPNGDQRPDEGR